MTRHFFFDIQELCCQVQLMLKLFCSSNAGLPWIGQRLLGQTFTASSPTCLMCLIAQSIFSCIIQMIQLRQLLLMSCLFRVNWLTTFRKAHLLLSTNFCVENLIRLSTSWKVNEYSSDLDQHISGAMYLVSDHFPGKYRRRLGRSRDGDRRGRRTGAEQRIGLDRGAPDNQGPFPGSGTRRRRWRRREDPDGSRNFFRTDSGNLGGHELVLEELLLHFLLQNFDFFSDRDEVAWPG